MNTILDSDDKKKKKRTGPESYFGKYICGGYIATYTVFQSIYQCCEKQYAGLLEISVL